MKINIENLTKLADFLESEIKDEQFDIYAYRKKFGEDYRLMKIYWTGNYLKEVVYSVMI